MSKDKGPIEDRDKNKDQQGKSRNLSNRMYGSEEGDEKPSAAEGLEGENTADREGAVEKNTAKSKISYEPDKDKSGAQGAHGQGNGLNKGTEGAQGYGQYQE